MFVELVTVKSAMRVSFKVIRYKLQTSLQTSLRNISIILMEILTSFGDTKDSFVASS